ncbi:MAG: ornithine cyclodeaminase family protein [Bryobacterales bacterium]|nr:ornithine cyclodeaminase family protein [Bryobacterales bacterium]
MLHVTEEQVRELLSMDQCVKIMRQTFLALRNGTASNQPRRRINLDTGSTLHSMGGAYGKYFGTKFYTSNPKYGSHFFFYLFDSETARPLAQFEANCLGQIRTGAASGYATDVLAAPAATSLAVIGSGFQAQSQIDAIRCVRDIKDLRVWSRKPEKREAFAKANGGRATETAEEAVRGAGIVVTATFAKDPVIEDSWIEAGAHGVHINAMGSNREQRREIPSRLVHRADLIAVDTVEVARIEAGDLIMAPVDWSDRRIVELAKIEHRPAGAPITIFKSCGLGVEDVSAAAYIYERLAK